MNRMLPFLLVLFLPIIFACSDDETSSDTGTTVADARADSRVRPDGGGEDTETDTGGIDQGIDQTTDVAVETGTDTVEDSIEDVGDVTADMGEDTGDTGTDTGTDTDLGDDALGDVTDTGGDTDTGADTGADTADMGDTSGTVQPATPGDLVIIEVQGNPHNLVDENAEYIEIYNRRSHPVALSGVTIGYAQWDNTGLAPVSSADFHPLVTEFEVPAKDTALLVRSADTGLNGGLTPDVVYGGTVINNGLAHDCRIRLLVDGYSDETSGLIDEMVFPGATFQNDLRGRSYQFDMPTVPNPTAADNENDEYLCHTPAVEARQYSLGNWGTPGTGNLPCP